VRVCTNSSFAKLRAERNNAEVQAALDAITRLWKQVKVTCWNVQFEAAKKRATLGEISYACEKVVGRYKAAIRSISVFTHQNQ
jgi:methylmalonyl-CoA mutase